MEKFLCLVVLVVSGVDAEAHQKATSGLWDGQVTALRWAFWRAMDELREPKMKLWARKIHASEWRRLTQHSICGW